jgi:hypothetical protein
MESISIETRGKLSFPSGFYQANDGKNKQRWPTIWAMARALLHVAQYTFHSSNDSTSMDRNDIGSCNHYCLEGNAVYNELHDR